MTKKTKYRSKAEAVLAEWFRKNAIEADYEARKYKYKTRVYSGICGECGSKEVFQQHIYLLDFWLPEHCIGIELKGRLNSEARTKMKQVKLCNPEADIRLVFLSDNKLSPKSTTRYSEWAKETGYLYSVKVPDGTWFGKK